MARARRRRAGTLPHIEVPGFGLVRYLDDESLENSLVEVAAHEDANGSVSKSGIYLTGDLLTIHEEGEALAAGVDGQLIGGIARANRLRPGPGDQVDPAVAFPPPDPELATVAHF